MDLGSNNDYSTISKSFPSISPLTQGNEENVLVTEKIQTEKTTIGIDTQVYDGADTILPYDGNRFETSNKESYVARAQTPTLVAPDEEGQMGPQPYGIIEQKLIVKYFSRETLVALAEYNVTVQETKAIYSFLMTGEPPLTDPKLVSIAKQVKEKVTPQTREQGNLPSSWTLESKSKKDWIPKQVKPYDEEKQEEVNQFYDNELGKIAQEYIEDRPSTLTSEQKEKLKIAITTGPISSEIAELYTEITAKATQATIKAYGLSDTWFRGTDNLEDWKPINLGIVTPTTIKNEQVQELSKNLEDYLTNLMNTGKKVLPDVAKNSPNALAMKDFLRAIADAIKDLKAVLRDMQLQDADKTEKVIIAKLEQLKERGEIVEKEMEKSREARQAAPENNKTKNKFNKVMQVVGPIIGVLTIAIGAALSIFGGVGIPLILAGVAIGLAFTAYSVADSQLGLTGKIMTAFNNMLEEAMPNSPPWVRSLVKVAIVVGVVAILSVIIAAAVLSGSTGAAASVAVQVIGQTAKQFAIQAIIMTIVSTNAVPELLANSLIAAGVSEKDGRIAQIVIMAVQMLVIMAALAVGGGKISPKNILKDISDSVKETAKGIQNAMREFIQFLRSLPSMAKDAVSNIPKVAEELLKIIKGIPTTIKNFPTELWEETKGILEGMKSIYKVKGFRDFLGAAENFLRTGVLVTQTVSGVLQGLMMLQVAKLLKAIGELKAAEELLQELIKMLEKLLKNMQGGMEETGEFIASLQRDFNNIFDSLRQSQAKMIQASVSQSSAM